MAEQLAKADALILEICAMDRAPYRMEAKEVTFPGTQGLFQVLPGHAPMFSSLDAGILSVKDTQGQRLQYAIGSGLTRVLDNKIVLLTRTAESSEDIDLERAEAAKQRAEERLNSRSEQIDVMRAEAALQRALIRLKASHKM